MSQTGKVRIYHNPRCSKSRETLEIIRKSGIDPEIIEYLKAPPEKGEIVKLLGLMRCPPRDMMRKGEDVYKENGLGSTDLSDDSLIEAMEANPILIERPIVVTEKGCRICRPPEKVKEIL